MILVIKIYHLNSGSLAFQESFITKYQDIASPSQLWDKAMGEENVFVDQSGLPCDPAISCAVVLWGLMTFFRVEKWCFSPVHTNHMSGQGHKRRCREFWASGFSKSGKLIRKTLNHFQNVFPPSDESGVLWIISCKRVRTCRPPGDGVPNRFLLIYASCLVCLPLCQSVNSGRSWLGTWPWIFHGQTDVFHPSCQSGLLLCRQLHAEQAAPSAFPHNNK